MKLARRTEQRADLEAMTTRRSLHYADVVEGDQSVVSSRKTQDWHFVRFPMCIDLHVQAVDHVKRLQEG